MHVLIVSLVLHAQPSASAPMVTHGHLKEVVLSIMRDDPSSVEPFRLEIDDTTLYYRFGGLKDLIGKIPSTPLDVPLATQFSVEAVRNYRWGPESAKLVSTFLLRTEAIIERELSLIANPRNSEVDLLGAMLQYQRQTDDILLSLPSYFAKRERRWLAPVGSVISFDQCANKYVTSSYYFEPLRGDGVGQFEPLIKFPPKAARVHFIGVRKYNLAKIHARAHGNDPDTNDSMWGEVAHETERLGGVYYFKIYWTDGRPPTKTAMISVTSNAEIRLRSE